MPWNNDPLTLWHGTIRSAADDIDANGVNLALCPPKKDFARGFYTTRVRSQAVKWANDKYKDANVLHVNDPKNVPAPRCASLIEFSIGRDALGSLDTLAFVQPTDDWQEFVRFCRFYGRGHRPSGTSYDVVYGPVSNRRGEAFPELEQLSFNSNRAIRALNAAKIQVHHGGPTLR